MKFTGKRAKHYGQPKPRHADINDIAKAIAESIVSGKSESELQEAIKRAEAWRDDVIARTGFEPTL